MAGRKDITIYQGSTFTLSLTIKRGDGTPFPLTGYSARGQIRRHMRSCSAIQEFTCVITPPPEDGQIVISLTPQQTGAITAGDTVTDPRSKYVYDVEIYQGTPPSETAVKRVIEGYAYIDPEVTRLP